MQIIAIDMDHKLDGTMGNNKDMEELDQWAESTNAMTMWKITKGDRTKFADDI